MPKSLMPVAAFLLLSVRLFSQPGGGYDAVSVYKDIQRLGVLANVLYVAAHPDDENTRMISYLSNHLGVRTTYLSLTRGDGGQNLIGPEIREMLGIIRTHELLGARAIDGGHQLFTRANDFGYSKTPAETFNIWNRNDVLSDVVWAMRRTRPDVIINRFSSDTSRPNHGHHTASAILSTEAFDLAGRKDAFPEQLTYAQPWQPRRIFWNTSWWFYGSREAFDKADKSRMIGIDIGAYDPITGESNSEIAGRSRSMHKSQGFGSAETRGESMDYIELLKDANGTIPKTLFEGIDITWNRVPGGARIGEMVRDLEKNFDFRAPSKSLPAMLAIHQAIESLPDSWWRTVKMEESEALVRKCLGLYVEARTNAYTVSPGNKVPLTLEIINRSPVEAVLDEVSATHRVLDPEDIALPYNIGVTRSLTVSAPDKLSTPYWLSSVPTEGMYRVDDQRLRGLPADDPVLHLDVTIRVEGHPLHYEVPVVYKTVDPAQGEITRPVSVTPPVAISMGEEALVFQLGKPRTIPVTLTALQDSVSGTFTIKTGSDEWSLSQSAANWNFRRAGESSVIGVTVFPPKKASATRLRPVVTCGDQAFADKVITLDYPHLPYMSVVAQAEVRMEAADIAITPRRIAYLPGAGDDVANALRQIGYAVQLIGPEDITTQNLANFDVVITGIRAFNTVDALAYKNRILFDWIHQGGTMIVQYNTTGGLVTNELAPLPLTLSRDRVTQEDSPVKILQPEHPALQTPNKITAADFDGWKQERGLYFPREWDPAFVPLLEMNDTGENPTRGALLVAPVGKGHYVYSGLSWFRHLPAGVTGEYRILSNLISLGHRHAKS